MIKEIFTAENEYLIRFENFTGTGWKDSVTEIITNKIKPQILKKREIEVSWDYSEYEYDVEKDNIKFIFHIDDEGSRYFILQSEVTEENQQKLREWATIVAKEVEKQRKK